MRFGLLGPDDDQADAALKRDSDAYLARLAELAGHVEFNLKAARDEQDLLLEIVTESDQIRELNERTRSGSAGQEDRIALGELVAAQVAERNNTQAEKTLERLLPCAARASRAEPGASLFLNVSFLVPATATDTFVRTVRDEADRQGEACTFTLTGPLPPYSFV